MPSPYPRGVRVMDEANLDRHEPSVRTASTRPQHLVSQGLQPCNSPVLSPNPINIWCGSDPDPGQLVLVVREVHQARARDGGEATRGFVVGLALEFQGADEVPASPGGEPGLDQAIEPLGIADDVRDEPIDG